MNSKKSSPVSVVVGVHLIAPLILLLGIVGGDQITGFSESLNYGFLVFVAMLLVMTVTAFVTVFTLVKKETALVMFTTIVFSIAGQLALFLLIYVIFAN